MKALNLESLNVSIAGTRILKDISFSVNDGETVGIIGPNGSGKTTLFNALSGFVRVDSGLIEIKGQDVSKESPSVRAQIGLGRVFQNSGVFRDLTLLENMLCAIEGKSALLKSLLTVGHGSAETKNLAMQLLDEIGLADRASEKAASLSGGQLRLLEIVRTVASRASVILLDEPTAGVSPKLKDSVSSLIIRLKETGKTLIAIEHDLRFIESFCERIIVLNEGQVALQGNPEEIRSSSLLKEIYFGK